MSKSLFAPPKNKRIAKIVSIKSPSAFTKSIKRLKANGLSLEERRALVLARTRAKLQLRRKNLSKSEKVQFTQISRVPI